MEDVPDDLPDPFCAVCLQSYEHPTKLPCGHVFCFLCVKGVALQNKTCAMCRDVIPNDYLNNPVVLPQEKSPEENHNQGYQWYYEGANGWWKYDKRSNEYLEETHNSGKKEGTLLLAGNLYRINFEKCIQVRINDHRKIRKMRRDTPFLPSKGIAGIRLNDGHQTENPVGFAEDTLDADRPVHDMHHQLNNDPIVLSSDDDLVNEISNNLRQTKMRAYYIRNQKKKGNRITNARAKKNMFTASNAPGRIKKRYRKTNH